MAKITIIVDVESSTECKAVDSWFDKWRPELKYVLEQEGCGCCIYLWNVEGPNVAIEELPQTVVSKSEWSDLNRI